MEKGFFHPNRGYWQTTNEPPQHILDGYPEGTIEVPIKPGQDYEWQGDEWVLIPPDPAEVLAAAKAALAAHRYEVETGGVSVGGIVVATDRQSQSMITGAVSKAQRDPNFVTRWKGADGNFTTVDASTILMIGDAVSDHIAACFDREASLLADLEAAEDAAALEAIDITAGWPA